MNGARIIHKSKQLRTPVSVRSLALLAAIHILHFYDGFVAWAIFTDLLAKYLQLI